MSGFDFFPAECTISSILCVQRRLFGFLLITLFAPRLYTHTPHVVHAILENTLWPNHIIRRHHLKEWCDQDKKQLITLYVNISKSSKKTKLVAPPNTPISYDKMPMRITYAHLQFRFMWDRFRMKCCVHDNDHLTIVNK